jgi:hypothetical protein
MATPAVHHLHSPDQVAATAAQFRVAIGRLLEPGGLTRPNVAVAAAWFDGPVFRLLDGHEELLEDVAGASSVVELGTRRPSLPILREVS